MAACYLLDAAAMKQTALNASCVAAVPFVAQPPATPGPGATPPPPPPMPPWPAGPDVVPPEIEDPEPLDAPFPVREPPQTPTPIVRWAWYSSLD